MRSEDEEGERLTVKKGVEALAKRDRPAIVMARVRKDNLVKRL